MDVYVGFVFRFRYMGFWFLERVFGVFNLGQIFQDRVGGIVGYSFLGLIVVFVLFLGYLCGFVGFGRVCYFVLRWRVNFIVFLIFINLDYQEVFQLYRDNQKVLQTMVYVFGIGVGSGDCGFVRYLFIVCVCGGVKAFFQIFSFFTGLFVRGEGCCLMQVRVRGRGGEGIVVFGIWIFRGVGRGFEIGVGLGYGVECMCLREISGRLLVFRNVVYFV